ASWTSYQGIRFWVKRISGSEQGASLQLLWTRHYAGFPLTDTWTEVTMRWQEFTQRLYEGTCESKLAGIDTIEFTLAPGETHDGCPRGPVSFLIDDIRLVPGLAPLATPIPAAPDLPVTRARLASSQPLKVVCLGTSAITVMNYGVRGCKSWQGAAAIQDFVLREAPQLVLIEYLANDRVDAETAGGVAQYRDNMERLFDALLRWGQADVAVVLPNPNGEAGNTHLYDPYIAQLTAAAASRKLFVADVYANFLALPESTLLSYYLDPSVDHAHLNNTGCAMWAEVVANAITAKLSATAPPASAPPATTNDDGGGGGGGGCGLTGLEVVLLLLRKRRLGPAQ